MNTKPKNAMKKTASILLIGLASVILAKAQTESDPGTPAVTPATTAVAEPAATPPAEPAVPTEPAATPAATEPATAADNMSKPGPTTTTAATEPTDDSAKAPAPVGIPQIKFSDVPITTAIENLARLANINYMLDPKIGYGQPDANGVIKTEPVLSIRWENITAENALLALLDNYNLQLVHDKRTGIDRITVKDPAAPPPLFTKVVQLKYTGVSNMMEAAQSVLTDKRSKVLADSRTSQIIVVATDPEQTAIETLVAQLDKPTRQVLIETRLVQIATNPRTQKGVNWKNTLEANRITFGNTLTGGIRYTTTGGFTPDVGYLSADGLNVVLSFLNSTEDAQIMSTPRVVTLDNEQAKIDVTKTYPIFNVQAGTQNTAGGSSVTYSNVGTVLTVTPRISANDYIWLKVIPEVSNFAGDKSQAVAGLDGSGSTVLTAPTFATRKVETQVLIPNSNTLVLGGLVQDSPYQTTTKVPIMGDIPGLGFLFKSSDKGTSKDNLLIFITPTIVKDTDFQASTSGEFLKSKPIAMKDPLNPKTAWDGPVPAGEWSNPITDTTK